MTNTKIQINRINLFIFFSSFISFFINLLYNSNTSKGYELTMVFPILFSFLYLVTFARIKISNVWNKTTVGMYLILQWIRFVLMPPFIALAGIESGTGWIKPSQLSLTYACLFMMIDLVITFLVTFFIAIKKKKYTTIKRTLLKGNKIIYIGFIITSIIIYFIIGKDSNMLNFFMVSVTEERIGDITDTTIVIARQIILIAILLIFVWIVSFCAKKYKKTGNKFYIIFSIISAILHVGIIVGERRSTQVYTAFCSVWILYNAFPKYKKSIIYFVGGTAAVVLLFMSIYKFSSAFIYDSYLEAVQNSNYDASFISQTLQAYFSGPQGIAAVIEYSKVADLTFINLIYDVLRSTVPISFLVKGNMLTSQLYNSYMYGGIQITGQVISSVAYGYIYFGIMGISLFSIINIWLSSFFEYKLNKSTSFEMMYVWAYVLMRVALNLTANTPALLSSSSIMLVTGGLVFKIAQITIKKEKLIKNSI